MCKNTTAYNSGNLDIFMINVSAKKVKTKPVSKSFRKARHGNKPKIQQTNITVIN